MEQEIWKDILELDSQYQISNFGNVLRKSRKVASRGGFRDLKARKTALQDNGNGYKQLYVQLKGKRHLFYMHRLVGLYFIPNPNNLPEINHKDTIKANNHFTNLEWSTHISNMEHAGENNLMPKGEEHSNCKLTEQKVLAIRRLHSINPKFNRSIVANKLGVRNSQISRIIHNTRWKNLKNKIVIK